MCVKPDRCVKNVAIRMMRHLIYGLSWAEFLLILWEREVSHYRSVSKQTVHRSRDIIILLVTLTAIAVTDTSHRGSEIREVRRRCHYRRDRIQIQADLLLSLIYHRCYWLRREVQHFLVILYIFLIQIKYRTQNLDLPR